MHIPIAFMIHIKGVLYITSIIFQMHITSLIYNGDNNVSLFLCIFIGSEQYALSNLQVFITPFVEYYKLQHTYQI